MLREVDTALRAVRAASEVCRRIQARIAPETLSKDDRSPVTIADFASQAIVCRALSQAFPHDRIVAEEDSAELRRPERRSFRERVVEEIAATPLACETIACDSPEITTDAVCDWIDGGNGTGGPTGRFWTLDPIDGTKGFLRGEQYAVSLALIVDGRLAVGCLGCPNLGHALDESSDADPLRLFVAVRDAGSWSVDPQDFTRRERIHVSTIDDPAQARWCESVESGHSAQDESAKIAERLGIGRPPLRLDSQSKYATVAIGAAEAYLRLPTRADYREKIWDHAGGVLLVEEAGGRVTDVAGRPLDWTHGAELAVNRGVIVSNGPLHERILSALHAS